MPDEVFQWAKVVGVITAITLLSWAVFATARELWVRIRVPPTSQPSMGSSAVDRSSLTKRDSKRISELERAVAVLDRVVQHLAIEVRNMRSGDTILLTPASTTAEMIRVQAEGVPSRPREMQPGAESGPASRLVVGYNEDPRGFRDRFPEGRRFGVVNVERLAMGLDTEPEFGFQGSSDFIFVPESAQSRAGFAFPRARVLGSAVFKAGCLGLVFASNYDAGFRYKTVRVKNPAKFAIDGELLVLTDRGEIELLEPEAEV